MGAQRQRALLGELASSPHPAAELQRVWLSRGGVDGGQIPRPEDARLEADGLALELRAGSCRALEPAGDELVGAYLEKRIAAGAGARGDSQLVALAQEHAIGALGHDGRGGAEPGSGSSGCQGAVLEGVQNQ